MTNNTERALQAVGSASYRPLRGLHPPGVHRPVIAPKISAISDLLRDGANYTPTGRM